MAQTEFETVTPGEMLKVAFLAEYGLSRHQLAKAIGISPNRITDIVNNLRRSTTDTALRFSLYFGNSPEFWLNLQTNYESEIGAAESQADKGDSGCVVAARIERSESRDTITRQPRHHRRADRVRPRMSRLDAAPRLRHDP